MVKGDTVKLTMSCNSAPAFAAREVIKVDASLFMGYLFASIENTAKRKSSWPSFVISASKSLKRRCDGICSKAAVNERSSSEVPETTSLFCFRNDWMRGGTT